MIRNSESMETLEYTSNVIRNESCSGINSVTRLNRNSGTCSRHILYKNYNVKILNSIIYNS